MRKIPKLYVSKHLSIPSQGLAFWLKCQAPDTGEFLDKQVYQEVLSCSANRTNLRSSVVGLYNLHGLKVGRYSVLFI